MKYGEWEVLHIEKWKRGVKRLYLRCLIGQPQFRMEYVKIADYRKAISWRARWAWQFNNIVRGIKLRRI